MDFSSALFYFVTLCTIFKAGEGIKCHLCNSDVNPQCGDPFNPDNSLHPVECTPDSLKSVSNALSKVNDVLKDSGIDTSGLLKAFGFDKTVENIPDITKAVCQKVSIQVKDKKTIIRSCTLPKSSTIDTCADYEKVFQDNKDVKVTYCDYCDHDGCNAASGINPGTFLVSLVSALSLAAIFKAY